MLISEGRAMLGVIALHCGGGDVGKTKWLMYTRCQCSIIYPGSKVDMATGTYIEHSDYRHST
jgi:hypothetical protein